MALRQSGRFAALGTGDADVAMEPGTLTAVHTPAAATQASAAAPAPGAGKRLICRGIHGSVAAAGAAQAPIRLRLVDGDGNVLWSKKVACPANSFASVDITGLCIPTTNPNKSLTLEFAAAGVATSEEDVTLAYVVVQD